MVTLPPEFVATRIPGYFWNTITKTLFSIKSGTLRQMALVRPNRWNRRPGAGYEVSNGGKRVFMTVNSLLALQPLAESVIPMEYGKYAFVAERGRR